MVFPYTTPQEGTIWGSARRGTPNRSSSSSSQPSVSMFISMVRDALVTSVTNVFPR
jgi:hypothetical protein